MFFNFEPPATDEEIHAATLLARELVELDDGPGIEEISCQRSGLLQAHGEEAEHSLDTTEWLGNEIGSIQGIRTLFATSGDLPLALCRSREVGETRLLREIETGLFDEAVPAPLPMNTAAPGEHQQSVAAQSATPPPIRELQLATLVDAAPEGPEWLHEQKFDGYRILAELDHGKVRLLSRRFKDWTAAFPTIAAAVGKLPATRALVDGEVAAVLPDGRTSFQALQNARGAGGTGAPLLYFAFDLLALDGDDLTPLPLEDRKARLAQLLARARGASGAIRYSDHVIGDGAAFFALACQRGLEGIISKRRDRPYQPGRGMTWLKVKCLQRQELVIGGFTDPEGSRQGIGALLVGYHAGPRLVYAGKVGTGYTHKLLRELREQLDAIERPVSPFSPEPPRAWTGGGRHWVAPELVAEVAFSEWTNDGRLRHPSFQGLRLDKPARDVVREAPVHAPSDRARAARAPAARARPARAGVGASPRRGARKRPAR